MATIIVILSPGGDSPIHLGRSPAMNECAGVQLTCRQCDPFPTQRHMARDEDTTFVVEIGPSANPRGYTGITGTCTYRIAGNIWRELNLTVEPQIAIARILLADLNLAVQYGIVICIILYTSRKFWRILIWRL